MDFVAKNFQHGKVNRQNAPANICSWIYPLVSQDHLHQTEKGNVEGSSQNGELSNFFCPPSTHRKAGLKRKTKKYIPELKSSKETCKHSREELKVCCQ